MKVQLIFFTFLLLCISEIKGACDSTTKENCEKETSCEWKVTPAACGDTTVNEAGAACTSQTTSGTCTGKCVFNDEATTKCANGNKLANDNACSTATTSTACDGKCTWTEESGKCSAKATTTDTSGSFGLKYSSLISFLLFLY